MDNEKIVNSIVEKCEIYYQDSLVSGESIIEEYLRFFSKQFDNTKRSVNFAFHTGSLCFDVAAIAAVVIGCLAYDLSSNDDILQELEIGDMVLYKGERYRWGGIKPLDGSQTLYAVLTQDAKGKNGISIRNVPYERYKHLIKPYYGTSKETDGRGIRKAGTNRNNFISFVLGIPETDVPSTIDNSIVVLADKQQFIDICKNLRIVYGDGKFVVVTDILPVSYYSSTGEESQIGTNPSKAEAVIKVAGKISTARDLALDKSGNRAIGLLVLNSGTVDIDSSEFNDTIRRKSLKFVHIMCGYSSKNIDFALEQHDDAGVFACTKEYLSEHSHEVCSANKLTEDLSKQIDNIVNHSVNYVNIAGGWSWNDFRQVKENLFALKQSDMPDESKENFILSSMVLIKLFTTSFFNMECLENAIAERRINSAVMSPKARLLELQEIATNAPYMQDVLLDIANKLDIMYNALYKSSPKGDALVSLLHENNNKRIAFVIPKAYYGDIFALLYSDEFGFENVSCITANRFNFNSPYDMIITVGDVVGKKFDSVDCYAASEIHVLLYEAEEKLFLRRKLKHEKAARKLNARIKGLGGEEYIQAIDSDKDENDIIHENIITKFSDLDSYVESLGTFDIRRFTAYNTAQGASLVSEIKYVGAFTTGEYILFSKYYSAVVFNQAEGETKETSPDKLVPGDILVFTKRNSYTQNIVDTIFEQLLTTHGADTFVIQAAEKASYWKSVLRDYKTKNNLSYRTLSKKLQNLGCTLQDVTIRQWLVDESHIVGPQDETVMKLIGILTDDPYICADPHGYFEACRAIRRYRRKILELISMAINEKLSNRLPSPGSVFEVVYDNIDKLAEFLEIDTISELDDDISVNSSLANRPIEESEV